MSNVVLDSARLSAALACATALLFAALWFGFPLFKRRSTKPLRKRGPSAGRKNRAPPAESYRNHAHSGADMTTIVAGRFETLDRANQAKTVLAAREFDDRDVSAFAMNPPGQHGEFPIGGDVNADAGARRAHFTAVSGALLGGAAGLVLALLFLWATKLTGTMALAGAVAVAAVGAYVGSLAGALRSTGNAGRHRPRQAGIMLAVNADSDRKREVALDTLRSNGARDIEVASGTWRDGEWVDFDATASPGRA
jgi:hypothetical protein